jgi:ATP-dependent DNA helicase RecG
MKLDSSVREIKGIGDKTEKRLNRLEVKTVRDLLFHFPYRYEDYTQVKDIANLQKGDNITIKGRLEAIKNKRSKTKSMIITDAVIADDTGQIRVVWFSQPYVKKKLETGEEVYLSGQITEDKFGLELVNPKFEKEDSKNKEYTSRILPQYHLTEGLTEKKLTSSLQKVIDLAEQIEDWIPEQIKEDINLIDLDEAVKLAHFPEETSDFKQAKFRLKFNELFLLQLKGEAKRKQIKTEPAPKIDFDQYKTKKFVNSLPFELTKDQKIAAWEVVQDLQQSDPMNRMLEGDVGAGKTVVATLAAYNVSQNEFQVALMAPTEILAEQHFRSMENYLGNYLSLGLYTNTNNGLSNKDLSEKNKTEKRRTVREEIESGEVDLVLGTHALISEKMQFNNLGLAVVDEQHRFGVKQRKKLKEKSGNKETMPHFLSMTATPIPRSFALTLYGDLDLSVIKQMPPGRKPTQTRLVEEKNRPEVYEFLADKIEQDEQAFVVCPLIEPSENMADKKSVRQEYQRLNEEIFPQLQVEQMHGNIDEQKKSKVMQDFAAGEIDILVSTTVIEVGVDVPRATIMVIENAERFGLAQLHQLRGRIGRGGQNSFCFLFSDSTLEETQERLNFFENHVDGFKVAEYDLKLRGPGEVYGKRQSGLPKFQMASIEDKKLIKLTRKIAREINFTNYPKLQEKVNEFNQEIHLE